MSPEEHIARWPKLDLNLMDSVGRRWVVCVLIGSPKYTFRNVKSGAIRMNIHQQSVGQA